MAHSRSAVSVSGAVGVRLSQQQIAGVPPTDVEDHFVGHNSSWHKMMKFLKKMRPKIHKKKELQKLIRMTVMGF